MGQRGGTAWFTGLSGSGKSTVAVALEKALLDRGFHATRLDGDNVRRGLCANLGFSPDDRAENIRRIGEVAKLQAEAGLVCLASFVSPYARDRDRVKRDPRETPALPFVEVFVAVPLSVAEARDPKGLYKKARAGEIKGFTGIDDPYEEPTDPDLRLDTDTTPLPEAVEELVGLLEARAGAGGVRKRSSTRRRDAGRGPGGGAAESIRLRRINPSTKLPGYWRGATSRRL